METPVGFIGKPPLCYSAAAGAMWGLERFHLVQVTVPCDKPFFRPDLDVPPNSIVSFPTSYGIYSDPISQRELTVVLLIVSGIPADFSRLDYSPGRQPVRISQRPSIRTNLLVTSHERIVEWNIALRNSLVTYDIIQKPRDIEPYREKESVSIFDEQDLVIVTSDMISQFIAVCGVKRWARLILEVFNEETMDIPSEFRWYLTDQPQELAASNSVGHLFARQGVVYDDYNHPELFTVQNSPAFLEKCRSLKMPERSASDMITRVLDDSLCKLYLEQNQLQKKILMRSEQETLQLREQFQMSAIVYNETLHNSQDRRTARCANAIMEMIRKWPTMNPCQEGVILHETGDLMEAESETAQRVRQSYESFFVTKEKVLFDACFEIQKRRQDESVRAAKEHRENLNQVLFQMFRSVPRTDKYDPYDPPTSPAYVLERFVKKDPDFDTIAFVRASLMPSYVAVQGIVQARTVLAESSSMGVANVFLGISHGVRVSTRLISTGRKEIVVLIANRMDVADNKKFYNSSRTVPTVGNTHPLDTMIIQTGSEYRLIDKVRALYAISPRKVAMIELEAGTVVYLV